MVSEYTALFANCCGSSEAETRHFSWSPLPAKTPHPLPILRAGWGRKRRGRKWRRSWLFWPKPCKICRAELPRVAISDQKALKAFISSNWGSRIQRWQNGDEWLIYMPWTNNRESVNLGPSTLKKKKWTHKWKGSLLNNDAIIITNISQCLRLSRPVCIYPTVIFNHFNQGLWKEIKNVSLCSYTT